MVDPSGHEGELAELLTTIGIGLNIASLLSKYSRFAECLPKRRYLQWRLLCPVGYCRRVNALGPVLRNRWSERQNRRRDFDDHGGVAFASASTVTAIAGYLEGLAAVLPGFSQAFMAAASAGGNPDSGITPINGSGMPAPKIDTAPNGRKVTIFGQSLHARANSPGHSKTIDAIKDKLVATGDYQYIFMQRTWVTATGRISDSQLIPDVLGVRYSGKIDVWEVLSPSDVKQNKAGEISASASGRAKLPPIKVSGKHDYVRFQRQSSYSAWLMRTSCYFSDGGRPWTTLRSARHLPSMVSASTAAEDAVIF